MTLHLSENEARVLMSRLGKVENELVGSFTAPLWWVLREADGSFVARNGSAFFLDAGRGVFGVTAHHVLEQLAQDRKTSNVVAVQLAKMPLALNGRHLVIGSHQQLDIATFRISRAEIQQLGKTVLTG